MLKHVKTVSIGVVVFGLLSALILCYSSMTWFNYGQLAGSSVMQSLIGSSSFIFAAVLIAHRQVRNSLMILIPIATLFLCWHRSVIVRKEEYSGNPSAEMTLRMQILQADIVKISEMLRNVSIDRSVEYEPGWLVDIQFLRSCADLKRTINNANEYSLEVKSFWHSRFTHIYSKRLHPVRVWFLGGTIRSWETSLEWRTF